MANPEHLEILKQGVEAWNAWRATNDGIMPDLRGANLISTILNGADLREADLSKACLHRAQLKNANLWDANLSGTNLIEANLIHAKLGYANLKEAILIESNLSWTNLREADLSWANLNKAQLLQASLIDTNFNCANLSEANLTFTIMVRTKFNEANLSHSRIYGVSAWDLLIDKTNQSNLIISNIDDPTILVDDLEVAQFVYLLLNRKKFRNVIDTITSKSVLILGRFTPERKEVLDSIADELRRHKLLPIIFDFERASSRDFTETIKTLAGMSLFVIADITNPSSAPLELQAIVPDYQIPFVPILQEGEKPFAMFRDLQTKYSWVIKLLTYPSVKVLIKTFKKAIIDEAFEMHKKLLKAKAEAMETRSAEDYLKESD